MNQQNIDQFIAAHSEKFLPEHLYQIKARLASVDDSKFLLINTYNYKDPTTYLIISLFAGSLGLDRFLLDEIGLGVVKLLTCGGMGIWTLIDWFLIMNKTRQYNFQKLMTLLAQ